MSQPPPIQGFPNQPPQPFPPQQPRTNGWAIASLICGILGCFPFLTSILAIVFGFLGIGAAKHPMTGGKGMSIAGLILGFVGILSWGGLCLGGPALTRLAPNLAGRFLKPLAQPVVHSFVKDLADGDMTSASAMASSNLQPQLPQLSSQIKSYGNFQSLSITDLKINQTGQSREPTIDISGVATFDSGAKNFTGKLLTGSGSGQTFKVDSLSLD